MDFEFTPEEKEFQKEVRQFFHSESKLLEGVCQEIPGGGGGQGYGPYTWELLRKLGERRWLAPIWPEEYGGLNGSYMQRFIIFEESSYHGGPFGGVGSGMAGPVIMHHGSEEQKKEFLLRIARGEIEFALGYTEPQAGSDLAALEIRAEDKGDYYLMNGQKVFNTRVHYSQYHWLGVKTDPNAVKKHRGISLFIVDLKSPGITIRPLWGMGGLRTNEVFYDNVKVPKKNRVGEENRGWYYIVEALDFERTFVTGSTRRIFEQIVDYVKETKCNGQPLAKDPIIRQKLGGLAIELDIAYLLAARIPWMLDRGIIPSHQAAMLKMYATELEQRLVNQGMQILGLYGQLVGESKWLALNGEISRLYLDDVSRTFVAGTSEIMRNIIAQRGSGLPR